MLDFRSSASPFLKKVIVHVEENLSDEHFGVTELAAGMSMSRSTLLRKIKEETSFSVSVFIRHLRLQKAKQLLLDTDLTASQISYQVGFNSTSYFTKCFRELYGYTPGEESKREHEMVSGFSDNTDPETKPRTRLILLISATILGLIIAITFLIFSSSDDSTIKKLPKSIAVLPFKNDSNDSTNAYLMNGLMQAVLNNFQKVEDIKVTSRTTAEKYRNAPISIPELSQILDVNYFVEGSGQKVGNEILLTVQLIEASSDRQIWSHQYKRELSDIFEIQMEVAQNIALEIGAIITPEEQKRIEKIPTQNLVAYDYYIKAFEIMDKANNEEELVLAIEGFKKAIHEDGQFAHAYAYIAICYYYIDIFRSNKQHTEELRNYADKAIHLDDGLGESLLAQALYHMHMEEYDWAVEYLEKTLTYYPHSAWAHNFLTEIYTIYLPDTEKYLTHAIQGIQAATADEDSVTASYTYLHLSNALAQTGFINQAEKYVQQSLDYNPSNVFSETLYTYIRLAKDFDLERVKSELITSFISDTTRIDLIKEIAKVSYTMKNYEEAWKYYEALTQIRETKQLDLYSSEDLTIGFVLHQLNRTVEAKKYFQSFLDYAENDHSIYKDLYLSSYYAVIGDLNLAIDHLKAFSNQKNYQYWLVLFMEKDPILLLMQAHPDFEGTIRKIRDQFWDQHEEVKKVLVSEGVIG